MSLETVKKLAEESGNEDLLSAVASLEENTTQNVNRIQSLEKDLQKAIEKRDRQSSIVKNTFGIDEITEDTLKSIVEKQTKPDEVLKAENENLLNTANTLKSEKEKLEQDFTNVQKQYKIEKSLLNLGANGELASQKAYDILLNEVSNGLSFDDNDKIVFKANDGTTIRNSDGSPMSLEDRYDAIRNSDEFQFLFKSKKSKSGSGTPNSSTSGTRTPTKGNVLGTKDEQLAYIKQKFNIG